MVSNLFRKVPYLFPGYLFVYRAANDSLGAHQVELRSEVVECDGRAALLLVARLLDRRAARGRHRAVARGRAHRGAVGRRIRSAMLGDSLTTAARTQTERERRALSYDATAPDDDDGATDKTVGGTMSRLGRVEPRIEPSAARRRAARGGETARRPHDETAGRKSLANYLTGHRRSENKRRSE